MKIKKTLTSYWWIIQGALLLGALVSVVVLIRWLKSPEGEINLNDIFEDQQAAWDWCPSGEVTIDPLVSIYVELKKEDICQVMTQAVSTKLTAGASWTPLLKVSSKATNESQVLEGDLQRGVFRVDGLPFYSPMLQEYLKAISSP